MSQSILYLSKSDASSKNNAIESRDYAHREFHPYQRITFHTKEDEDQWFSLSKSIDWIKPMVCSLAPHRPTLSELGICKDVFEKFNKASLDIDFVMGQPAYTPLVYEFVASFRRSNNDGIPTWRFRIQNTDFCWTRTEAMDYLGFPRAGVPAFATVDQRLHFWKTLTGRNHFGNASSPYSIACDAWVYIHRLVATNINCQPETLDYVSEEDLDIMWALDQGEPVDWFNIFSDRFVRMKEQYGTLRFVGCTSLITRIASKCGFTFHTPANEYRTLDLALMKKLSILARTIEPESEPWDDVEEDPEEEPWEDIEEEPEEDPEEDPEEEQPVYQVDVPEKVQEVVEEVVADKRRKIEIESGENLNDKVNWDRVRRVIVYEF